MGEGYPGLRLQRATTGPVLSRAGEIDALRAVDDPDPPYKRPEVRVRERGVELLREIAGAGHCDGVDVTGHGGIDRLELSWDV